MMETNFSISGQETQKLSRLNKIGIGIFIVGVLGIFELTAATVLSQVRLANVGYKEWIILGSFAFMLIGSILFTYEHRHFSLRSLYSKHMDFKQKVGLTFSAVGFGILVLSWAGIQLNPASLFLWLSLGMMSFGIMFYTYGSYQGKPSGIKNNHIWFNSLTNRGLLGWIAAVVLTLFYVQVYWYGDSLATFTSLFDPLSYFVRGKPADRWFLYGSMYTFVILFLGIKFIVKYRHDKYQIYRTISVIFFQAIFAYYLPYILESFSENTGYFSRDLKNIWPLNYSFADPNSLKAMQNDPVSGTFFFVWGIVLFLIITPVLTYFVGKRWYCSWVCGCGGLAETAGDSFRQLSSKKVVAWKIERWIIYSVMVFVLMMSIAALWPYFSGKDYEIGFLTITKNGYFFWTVGLLLLSAVGLFFAYRKYKRKVFLFAIGILVLFALLLSVSYATGTQNVFLLRSSSIKRTYGFFIGSIFAGVIGVGFYPILGNRIWCRFGCPMAGYMAIFQRFKSRFRITTNGSQCISCGNCSTYCEQGIDVRAYAQKGENIVRAACVGCGICSSVCPRGVLKLENGPEDGRFEPNPLIVSKDGVKLNA